MREQLRTLSQYANLAARLVVTLLLALLLLSAFILLSIVVVLLTSIPSWVGKLFPMDDWVRAGINRWLDIHRMQAFRDDMLQIFRRHIHIDESVDRYWMLQQMGDATDRIDKQLRNGRLVIAVFAAVASIILSVIGSTQYAGILVTIFALIISLLSLARIVIVDILAYDPDLFVESSHREIEIRMAWNRGPINGRGAILAALATVTVGVHDQGYQLGKWVLEEFIAGKFSDTEGKWSG